VRRPLALSTAPNWPETCCPRRVERSPTARTGKRYESGSNEQPWRLMLLPRVHTSPLMLRSLVVVRRHFVTWSSHSKPIACCVMEHVHQRPSN
jgi:hypothetical protein